MPRTSYQAYKEVCGCGGFNSTTPYFKKQHESSKKHIKWVAEQLGLIEVSQFEKKRTEVRKEEYEQKKEVCECGGFTHSQPYLKKQHESSEKHVRWAAQKIGAVSTSVVLAHHRKRLPDISECPCGADKSSNKSHHIETALHQYYIKHGVQKPLDAKYCREHRPGTKNPIDASKCQLCDDWHHTKNLIDGKVCRKCI